VPSFIGMSPVKSPSPVQSSQSASYVRNLATPFISSKIGAAVATPVVPTMVYGYSVCTSGTSASV